MISVRHHIFFVAIAMMMVLNGAAQSGYLGRYNSFNANVGVTPYLHETHEIVDDRVIVKNHVFTKHFNLSYSRIIGKRSVLSLNYSFRTLPVNIRGFTSGATNQVVVVSTFGTGGYTLLNEKFIQIEDLQTRRNGVSLNYTFYRKGNLAPIGKFISIGFSYGNTRAQSIDIIGGLRNPREQLGVNKFQHSFINLDTFKLEELIVHNDFAIDISLGRSIPLSDRFVLSLSVKHPVLQINDFRGRWVASTPLVDIIVDGTSAFYSPYFSPEKMMHTYESKSEVTSAFSGATGRLLKRSSWVVFDIGLSFFL
jgi:hypothetical protein